MRQCGGRGMTQDDIISMAREAGAVEEMIAMGRSDGVLFSASELFRFAALVAAAEREACALACEAIETRTWAVYKGSMDFAGESGRANPRVYGMSDGASECATAIRARGGNV